MSNNNQQKKLLYHERKNQGLCPRCGIRIKDHNYINCEDCRQHYRLYLTHKDIQKKLYQKRIANRHCPKCNKKLSKNHIYKLCNQCLQKIKEYKAWKKSLLN